MAVMGFKGCEESGKKEVLNDEDVLFRFDSGDAFSFADGLLHTLALGTTGSGKTRSVVLPALRNHIRAGHAGLTVDIKGNLRGLVRAIASEFGRTIVEYGTESTAVPVNILALMDESTFYDFCYGLIEDSFEGKTSNMDFHTRGVGVARDCFLLLRLMEKESSKYAPNLLTILEMFQNPMNATKLFEYFVQNMFKPDNKEHNKFVGDISGSQFHVLSYSKEKSEKNNNYNDQMSYITRAVITALKTYVSVPGVAENFCAHGANGIDMTRHLVQGDLVALRFSPDSGSVGAGLSRMVINSFYSSIYRIGLKSKRNTFVCIDEFQEVADLSHSRFSDLNFISQAREFKSGFIAATQSASALVNRCGSEAGVSAFISNCNNKVFFFSDDPLTRDIASRYNPDLDLIDLKPGEVFVSRFDSRDRTHVWGMDKVTKSYQTLSHLEGAMEEMPTPAMGESQRPTLSELVDKLVIKKSDIIRSGMPVNNEKDIEKKIIKPGSLEAMFPELFTENATVLVSRGWRPTTEKALKFFSEMKLELKICDLSMNSEYVLRAIAAKGNFNEVGILNRLLKKTANICMNCGDALPHSKEDINESELTFDMDGEPVFIKPSPVCEKCLKKYDLQGA